jgi:hypothetical protein
MVSDRPLSNRLVIPIASPRLTQPWLREGNREGNRALREVFPSRVIDFDPHATSEVRPDMALYLDNFNESSQLTMP